MVWTLLLQSQTDKSAVAFENKQKDYEEHKHNTELILIIRKYYLRVY